MSLTEYCGGGDCGAKPLTLIRGIRDSRQLVNVCISCRVVNNRCFLPPPADASINKGRKSRPLPARQPIQTTGRSGWRLSFSFFIQTQLALWYEQITFNCSKLYSCLRRIFVKMICAVKMILYFSCLCCVFFHLFYFAIHTMFFWYCLGQTSRTQQTPKVVFCCSTEFQIWFCERIS